MHGHSKKGTTFFFFQTPFKLIFNKYDKQGKVGEGHLNSYFYKKIQFL
jgi:hypothetical protein